MVTKHNIHTIDLNFLGISKAIASYLIPHDQGVVLIECGPGSTLPGLEKGLAEHGFTFTDVSDVLLTHIHLDHAGAAGWLAEQGAHIHVHTVGAPHMLNPERLLSSALRIYGDMMDHLWGDFLAVPKDRLNILYDGDQIEIGSLVFKAIDTPGHAYHHLAYLFEDICFSGDVGGIRLPGPQFLRLPTPPPEFHIESWRESIAKLKRVDFSYIAPTHFGIHRAEGHLQLLEKALDDIEIWMEATLPQMSSSDELHEPFSNWENARCEAAGIPSETLHAYNLAMPINMGADGIWRYWHKYRTA